jgi:hypothetical protein
MLVKLIEISVMPSDNLINQIRGLSRVDPNLIEDEKA